MADVADKLAASFLESQGWACIMLTPSDDSRSCVATVEGLAARDEPGTRVWLANKYADKVMAAFLSRCRESRRRPRGSGLVVSLPVTAVAGIIHSIAENFGIPVADDALITEQMMLISRRIGDALPRVTRGLGKQYANAREAARISGTPFPARYDIWLAERLRPALQAGL